MSFEKCCYFVWVLWCYEQLFRGGGGGGLGGGLGGGRGKEGGMFGVTSKTTIFYEVVNGVFKSSGYFSSTCAVVLGLNIGSH